MTPEEKIKKFEEIQSYLWDMAKGDSIAISTFCAAIIRKLDIVSPDGESSEQA